MVWPFGSALNFGAPGDTYVNRPTVHTSGSTHMFVAYMGLTSWCEVTVAHTLATGVGARPAVFRRRQAAMRFGTE
ncbi:hypothetical protein KAREA_46630 [Prescottella equi]|nr:hypothetical protein KAREA_46630 [Prescottella equi]